MLCKPPCIEWGTGTETEFCLVGRRTRFIRFTFSVSLDNTGGSHLNTSGELPSRNAGGSCDHIIQAGGFPWAFGRERAQTFYLQSSWPSIAKAYVFLKLKNICSALVPSLSLTNPDRRHIHLLPSASTSTTPAIGNVTAIPDNASMEVGEHTHTVTQACVHQQSGKGHGRCSRLQVLSPRGAVGAPRGEFSRIFSL